MRERSLDSRIRENDKRAIHVIPVETGIQKAPWIPACAGMTYNPYKISAPLRLCGKPDSSAWQAGCPAQNDESKTICVLCVLCGYVSLDSCFRRNDIKAI